ncbi:unnamed protein product [Protopolystoma xenopodis]|uniref:Tetraspanin n=1 Tax=Protopolystoma xenopodis TaxID=117903 RepID=A0A448WQR7_9PLAT|nr:unnamed protein product [Protopolystoma xenopodis]
MFRTLHVVHLTSWLFGLIVVSLGLYYQLLIFHQAVELFTAQLAVSLLFVAVLSATGMAITSSLSLTVGSSSDRGMCSGISSGVCSLLFVFSLALLVAFELACVLAVGPLRQGLVSQARVYLQMGLAYAIQDGPSAWLDNLQADLKCCGVKSFSDWHKSSSGTPPDSCCLLEDCMSNSLGQVYWSSGCLDVLLGFVEHEAVFFAWLSGLALLLQSTGLIVKYMSL